MLHVLLLLSCCCYISDREKADRSVLQVNDNLHYFTWSSPCISDLFLGCDMPSLKVTESISSALSQSVPADETNTFTRLKGKILMMEAVGSPEGLVTTILHGATP